MKQNARELLFVMMDLQDLGSVLICVDVSICYAFHTGYLQYYQAGTEMYWVDTVDFKQSPLCLVDEFLRLCLSYDFFRHTDRARTLLVHVLITVYMYDAV